MSKNLKDLRDKRKQEDEEENYRQAKKAQDRAGVGTAIKSVNILADEGTGLTDYNAKLTELLDRAGPLVEQVNALYNQYFSGTETRPPVERRKVLDGMMAQLEGMPKPTIQHSFRYNNIYSSFATYKNRWDKQCKAIENGRIKRPGGPKRAA